MQTQNVLEMDKLELEGNFEQPLLLGAPGEDGGYYTPSVKQIDGDTLTFGFTASKRGMPNVPPIEVKLPIGTNSGESVKNAVLYTKQNPTEEQKAQARKNIGAVTMGEVLAALPVGEGVKY